MFRSIHTHSLSPPHSNLLTLRTLTAPLNPADHNQITGSYASLPPFTTTLGTSTPTTVPGNEACFEVLSTGSSVKTLKAGDWCIAKKTGLGTWRTHIQVPEDKVVRVEKEGLTAKQVGGVSVNPVTAYRMLKDFVPLKEGEWYIQNGANSGVGRAALQLGKQWGLRSIAVIRDKPDEEGAALKREMEELGATQVITDSELQDRGFKDTIKEWTNGGKEELKLALNCVGGHPADALSKILSPGATMVTYGAMSKQPLRVGASALIFKDLRYKGFWVSRWSDEHPEEKRRTVEEILEMMRAGELVMPEGRDCRWGWGTGREELVGAVDGVLGGGGGGGKGWFVFEDM